MTEWGKTAAIKTSGCKQDKHMFWWNVIQNTFYGLMFVFICFEMWKIGASTFKLTDSAERSHWGKIPNENTEALESMHQPHLNH